MMMTIEKKEAKSKTFHRIRCGTEGISSPINHVSIYTAQSQDLRSDLFQQQQQQQQRDGDNEDDVKSTMITDSVADVAAEFFQIMILLLTLSAWK